MRILRSRDCQSCLDRILVSVFNVARVIIRIANPVVNITAFPYLTREIKFFTCSIGKTTFHELNRSFDRDA